MFNPVKSVLKKIFYSEILHRPIIKVYSFIKPPPYKLDNIEFHKGLWNGISTLHGTKCRPLGENNAYPSIYRENLHTEHQACKFSGTRNGMDINMTALRDVTAVWNGAMQYTIALRNDFIEYYHLPNKKFNLKQTFVFCKAGAAIPSYLARKIQNPVKNGELAFMHQAYFSLGVVGMVMVEALMEKGEMIVLEDREFSAQELADLAETSGALISEHDNKDSKVCAGSPAIIKKYMDILINGEYEVEQYANEVKSAMGDIDDKKRFYDYMKAATLVGLYIKINQYICCNSIAMLEENRERLSQLQKDLLDKNIEYMKDKNGIKIAERQIRENQLQIALGLVKETGDTEIKKLLVKKDIIDEKMHFVLDKESSIELACDNIKASTEELYKLSFVELNKVNNALGRNKSKKITIEDMYSKTSSPYITELTQSVLN